MWTIISFINMLAPVILVLLAFGIMFGVVRLKSVGFFLLFIALLPFLGSAITQVFQAGFAGGVSWKIWLIMGVIVLVAIRLTIDRVFRR
jgi:hypothetical protein